MLHKLEILRDELIAKGDAALTDLLNEHPSADRQHLRNLIRAAQKEKEQNKPSKAYREIYQILKHFYFRRLKYSYFDRTLCQKVL